MKFLEGKKTYITAAIGILTAIGSYLTGDATLAEAGKAVWVGLMAIFMRNGK